MKKNGKFKLRPPEGYAIKPDAEEVEGLVAFRIEDGFLIPVSIDGIAFDLESEEEEVDDEIEDAEEAVADTRSLETAFADEFGLA